MKIKIEDKCLWQDNLDLLEDGYREEKEQKERCKNCNGYELNCKDYFILPY